MVIDEEVECGDVSHRDDRVPRDAAQDQWIALVLCEQHVILVELIELLHLPNPVLIIDQAVVLQTVLLAEEDDAVLPLVTDPALVAHHADPFGAGMGLEMRILDVMLVENELRVPQLPRDHQWLSCGCSATDPTVHVALQVGTIVLHVADLHSVRNLCSGLLVGANQLGVDFFLLCCVLVRRSIQLVFWLSTLQIFECCIHVDMERGHRLLFGQARVDLASDREACVTHVVTLDAEDHEHVDLSGLRDVVVRQVDRLQCLAFGEGPLDRLDVVTEVHATQIDEDQLC